MGQFPREIIYPCLEDGLESESLKPIEEGFSQQASDFGQEGNANACLFRLGRDGSH